MKIIIRFCTQWGNYATKVCKVDNNVSIKDLKLTIQHLTGIDSGLQSLIFISEGQKIHLTEGSFLSEYTLTDGSMIYVNQHVEESVATEKKTSVVSHRYFSKLGIIQEEQLSLPMNVSMNLSDCEDQITYQKPARSAYADSLQDFIRRIKNKDWQTAKAILTKQTGKDFINDTRISGWNALHHASFLGFHEIVGELINCKADINIPTRDDWTPLLLAIQKNHLQVIQVLTDRMDLDVNYKSKGGNALFLASKKGMVSTVQLILGHPNFNKNSLDMNDFDMSQCHPKCYELIQNRENISHFQQQQRICQRSCSQSSFIEVVNTKPASFDGYLHKLNYLPLIQYRRYFVLDPDDGTFTRYKDKEDYPMRPIEVIALSNIRLVSIIKDQWYMEENMHYLEIKYAEKRSRLAELRLCSRQKDTIERWRDHLQIAIQYSSYLENKLTSLLLAGNISSLSVCMNEVFTSKIGAVHIKSSVSPGHQSPSRKQQPSPKSTNARSTNVSLEQPRQKQQFPQHLSTFQILKMIGNGSFGKVYQVIHKPTQRIYAMKQLSKAKLISKRQIKYAVSECNILKTVKSPYIINLFKSFQTPQYLYLIMEYCAGGDLALHLSRLGPFKESITKFIIKELSYAIEHLHELDILYRDLKPENILLDPTGHIKLVDFGLSKQMQQGMKAKSFCGSPAYLAPEMLGTRGATKATDVYGIGTVMFELLTGDPPYFNEDIDILYQNIRNGKLIIPSYISDEGRDFLLQVLQKEPSRRIGCKNINNIDWEEFRRAKWFEDVFSRNDKIKLCQGEETVDWVSDEEYERDSYFDKQLDLDYTEQNWKLNRVVDWSFDQLDV